MTNDGLVTYRRTGGLAGSLLVPDLATSLPTPTNRGLTYTFQLRRGIRYSTGALVRPDDIRHELERVFALGNGYPQSFYTGIVGAQGCMHAPRHCALARGIVVDDSANTVTFHLTAPDPDFLYKLAFPWAIAVPASTPDRALRRSLPPATGPYMTKSISPGRGSDRFGLPLAFGIWTLVRNPHFHEWSSDAQPSGFPDKIVLRQGTNQRQSVNDLEHGSLDLLLPVPTNDLSPLAAHFATQFHSEPLSATFAPAMNTRVAPFNNMLVRRALNYAIDRSEVVKLAGGPLAASPTCQILPPNVPGYRPYCPYTLNPNTSGSWIAPDLDRAKRLVRASGVRGMKVTLVVPPADATNPTSKIGPYLVAVLDRLGFRASLKVTANTEGFYATLADSRSHLQIGWFAWAQDYPAPSDFIDALLTCRAFTAQSSSNVNAAEFCQPEIDHAVQHAQRLEPSAPGSASQAWAAIDRQITDQAPWLPLYNPRVDIATSPRVGNYQYHPFFGLLLDQLWVH
jgi:peptide/nickel transport system substrate-binding protein